MDKPDNSNSGRLRGLFHCVAIWNKARIGESVYSKRLHPRPKTQEPTKEKEDWLLRYLA